MTIRFKLTMGAIAAILAANSLLVLANVRYFQQTWQEDLQTRVRLDLNSARTAYNNHVELVARSLGTASLDRSLAAALAEGRRKDYATWANRFYKAKGMDFFLLLDPQGKTLYRAQYSKQFGDDLAGNPLVAEAIQKKRSSSGSILLSARELQNEGPELVERAQFSLPNTPRPLRRTRAPCYPPSRHHAGQRRASRYAPGPALCAHVVRRCDRRPCLDRPG